MTCAFGHDANQDDDDTRQDNGKGLDLRSILAPTAVLFCADALDVPYGNGPALVGGSVLALAVPDVDAYKQDRARGVILRRMWTGPYDSYTLWLYSYQVSL